MKCKYCFYMDEGRFRSGDKSKIMSPETLEAVFSKTLPDASGRCVVVFQGGEPTLAGLDFFRCAVDLERKYAPENCKIENCLQTNGILINDAWAEFLHNENFLVGVSVDGPKFLHDENRVDTTGKGSFSKVIRCLDILKAHRVETNVLSVVTRFSAAMADEIYDFFDKKGYIWRQNIPCLSPFPGGVNGCDLKSGDYAEFLCKLFDRWYGDFVRGTPTSDRFFDNLTAILCGMPPEACDMQGVCSPQLVVEADGSVYPCDFYCMDDYCLGNFNINSLCEIENKREELGFIEKSRVQNPECFSCKWLPLCRGGCRRQRGEDGKSRFCDDYKRFFEYAYPRLCEVAQKVLSR